jgi:hypothetical protein
VNGEVIRETYVAVQVRDLEGPVVGTGAAEVGFSDEGVGTAAGGNARVVNRDMTDDSPAPVKLGVTAFALVGDPGPAGDTGALAVASARVVTHVHAFAASAVVPMLSFATIDVHIEGLISPVGAGASGAVHVSARAFDPVGIASPNQQRLDHANVREELFVDEKFSVGVSFPLLGGLFNYADDGLGLDLNLSIEAHSAGLNSTATLDFSGTMEIASFNFYDSTGAFLHGFSVIDETGASYPVNVPEPAGMIIAGCCLPVVRRVSSRGRR